eukprot:scaffold237_cov146-Skeletonema_menzelii.AAC.2
MLLLLPATITNTYLGAPIAKYIFVAMTVLTAGRSLVHIFLPDGGAQTIATFPLDRYPNEASDTIIAMFAQWGLTQLMMGLFYVLVIWRYQSLIPLGWALILFEWTGRLLIGFYKPIETIETPPGAIGNVIVPILALVMLSLALRVDKKQP